MKHHPSTSSRFSCASQHRHGATGQNWVPQSSDPLGLLTHVTGQVNTKHSHFAPDVVHRGASAKATHRSLRIGGWAHGGSHCFSGVSWVG